MITACGVFCFTIFSCLLKASFVRLYTKKWILNFIHGVFIAKYKGSSCTSDLEKSSRVLYKRPLIVPIQFTDIFHSSC